MLPGAAGPGGKNGIRVAKTQHRLVVTARSGVTPKEFEDAWERIVRLSAGEELHDFGAKFTAQGGSRVFEVAGQKYLAPEPIDSSETGPIEELVRRSKRWSRDDGGYPGSPPKPRLWIGSPRGGR